jgi:murein DD-endopeptidase MepM/ murein hydrolase activator NlpD
MTNKLSGSHGFFRLFLIGLFCILIFHPTLSNCATISNKWLKIIPARAYKGSAVLITFVGPKGVVPRELIRGKNIFPFFKGTKGNPETLVAFPLSLRHRKVSLTLFAFNQGKTENIVLSVTLDKKHYPVRTLRLKKHATLNAKTLKKIRAERAELLKILWTETPGKQWRGRFIKPVSGRVTSSFGVRRKINGTYMSVHHGCDFHAPLKTSIHVINEGTVVFCKKMVLSGLTLVIDHGLGLYSLYGHLSRARVKPGDTVKKGQVIALSGNTGRSTGPHLHLGVILSGIAVDPLSLIHLPL